MKNCIFHQTKKLVVILGPTASGKSVLAVKIAKKIDGEVVSADSRQVYRGLDIGSGKITKKEMRGIPHHLLDIASPKRTFTVARYQKLARKAIERIWRKKKIPILCGGTGFYIQAVTEGFAMPEVKPDFILRKRLDKKNPEKLFAILKIKDPERAAAVDPKNKRRLIRAIEIAEVLGKVPKLKKNPLEAEILTIGVGKEESKLRELIKRRLAKRINAGLIGEVKKLHDPSRGELSWGRLHNFGLEYRWTARLLRGKITREEFLEGLNKAIWHYAKRQMTWFRKMEKVKWVRNDKEAVNLVKKLFLSRPYPDCEAGG